MNVLGYFEKVIKVTQKYGNLHHLTIKISDNNYMQKTAFAIYAYDF